MKLSRTFRPISNPNNYKYYVYSLVDSRSNSVFYVGKGQEKRLHQHRKDALRGVCSKKCFRIKDIVENSCALLEVKVKGFHDEQEAYDYETDLIEYYSLGYLTNVLPGGQKAWQSRKTARDTRRNASKQEPTWKVILDRMHVIRDWAIQTGNGMFRVEPILTTEGKMPNFQNCASIFGARLYNDLIPVVLRQVINDKENGHKVIEALRKYGIYSICGVPINGSPQT